MRFWWLGLALLIPANPVAAGDLGAPVACAIGSECFVQQYPDLDATSGATDPFCGPATYDGHDGVDIRVRSMADVAKGVPVIASADGVVMGVRDGMPDHLVVTDADRAAVADVECGNGVLLDNGNGLVTQYCHMHDGSIAVGKGQSVKKGAVLGMIGASGLAQFPHVHLSVRLNDEKLDPTTGKPLTAGCTADPAARTPLWDAAALPLFSSDASQLLDAGFSGAPLDYDALVVSGPPPPPDANSQAFVGWAWFINLRQGDVVHLTLKGADGTILSDNAGDPLDANKATYSAFVGKKGAPAKGDYTLRYEIVRGGTNVLSGEKAIRIE